MRQQISCFEKRSRCSEQARCRRGRQTERRSLRQQSAARQVAVLEIGDQLLDAIT